MVNIRTETVRLYCEKYPDTIFFRVKRKGKWKPQPYSMLSLAEQDEFIKFWSNKEDLPHRVV